MANCYEKAKVYKLIDNTNGNIYIGSTCSPLCKRLSYHKTDFSKWKNGKHHYISSFKILENNDYDIILLEECPCENNEQLRMKERQWIDNLDCVNIKKPYTSKEEKKQIEKEWINKNIDKVKIWKKNYEKSDKCQQYRKKYKEDNKEQSKEYYIQYYKNIGQKQKQDYYIINKEKIQQYKSEKITCECGSIIQRGGKALHSKSKKHQAYLNNQSQINISINSINEI